MTTTTIDHAAVLERLRVEAEFLGWTLPELLADLRARLQRPALIRQWRYLRPDVAVLAKVLSEKRP